MNLQNEKCVMVIDEKLPLGIIANTAAIMGITLGKQMPEVVGADVYDKTGNGHLGIIEFPVPICIPVYVGGTLLDEVVVDAQARQNLRSGGR